jgi:hypothetical protein
MNSKLKRIEDGKAVKASELWSALQKYIRRGVVEKASLCCHALYYGSEKQKSFSYYKTLKRLLNIGFEDITIGNIPVLYEIYRIIEKKKDRTDKTKENFKLATLMNFTLELCQSKNKFRTPPLNVLGMYGCYDKNILDEIAKYYKTPFDLYKAGNPKKDSDRFIEEIKKGFNEKQLVRVLFGIGGLRLIDDDLLIKVFEVLLALHPELNTTKDVFEFCYEDKKKKYNLNVLYTAVVWCFYFKELNIEFKKYTLNKSWKEYYKLNEEKYKNGKYQIQLDDYVYDKHTLKGVQGKRDMTHFLDVGALLDSDILLDRKYDELRFMSQMGRKCYLQFEKDHGTKNTKSDKIREYLINGNIGKRKSRREPKTNKKIKTKVEFKKIKFDTRIESPTGWLTQLPRGGNKPPVYIIKGKDEKIMIRKGPYKSKNIPCNQVLFDKIKKQIGIPDMNSELVTDEKNDCYYLLIHNVFGKNGLVQNENEIECYTGNDGITYYRTLPDLNKYFKENNKKVNDIEEDSMIELLKLMLLYYVFQVSDTGFQSILTKNGKLFYTIDEQAMYSRTETNCEIMDKKMSKSNREELMNLMRKNRIVLVPTVQNWYNRLLLIDPKVYEGSNYKKDDVEKKMLFYTIRLTV